MFQFQIINFQKTLPAPSTARGVFFLAFSQHLCLYIGSGSVIYKNKPMNSESTALINEIIRQFGRLEQVADGITVAIGHRPHQESKFPCVISWDAEKWVMANGQNPQFCLHECWFNDMGTRKSPSPDSLHGFLQAFLKPVVLGTKFSENIGRVVITSVEVRVML